MRAVADALDVRNLCLWGVGVGACRVVVELFGVVTDCRMHSCSLCIGWYEWKKGGKLCVSFLSVCVLQLCLIVCYCRCVCSLVETCSSSLLVSSVTASRANTSH